MKNFKISISSIVLGVSFVLLGALGYAQQDIRFSFDNPQITNDGVDNYYEIDVMIQTNNTSTGTFKLGSGQLYFNYNTAAFGENVVSGNRIEVSYPEGEYIAGQRVDGGLPLSLYSNFTKNDNLSSRFSWAFSQTYSESTFAVDNVTPTPTKLCHLKLKFVDVTQQPMLMYEDDSTYDDQFFTACGSQNSEPFDTANCTERPGVQMPNDVFDNTLPILSVDDVNAITQLDIYPIPTKNMLFVEINNNSDYHLTDIQGKLITKGAFVQGINEIALGKYDAGVYFLIIENDQTTLTRKVIID